MEARDQTDQRQHRQDRRADALSEDRPESEHHRLERATHLGCPTGQSGVEDQSQYREGEQGDDAPDQGLGHIPDDVGGLLRRQGELFDRQIEPNCERERCQNPEPTQGKETACPCPGRLDRHIIEKVGAPRTRENGRQIEEHEHGHRQNRGYERNPEAELGPPNIDGHENGIEPDPPDPVGQVDDVVGVRRDRDHHHSRSNHVFDDVGHRVDEGHARAHGVAGECVEPAGVRKSR